MDEKEIVGMLPKNGSGNPKNYGEISPSIYYAMSRLESVKLDNGITLKTFLNEAHETQHLIFRGKVVDPKTGMARKGYFCKGEDILNVCYEQNEKLKNNKKTPPWMQQENDIESEAHQLASDVIDDLYPLIREIIYKRITERRDGNAT